MDLLTTIWDKTTDTLTAATEKLSGGLVRLFGASNERVIRSYQPLIERINALEEGLVGLTDQELRAKTDEFRTRLDNGATLDDLLPEAFAVCREGGKRFMNMRHYDVQLLGGIVLHGGNIAEMVTGEGKTLVATLPAYLNALTGQGVHVVTVNDYLARRDAEWMSPLYQGLGLTVDAIQADMDPRRRRRAYRCDITYGTNNEFGFDYLRDNMKPDRELQAQGPLNYAIIDEVDSILIDEARTPLIISGPAFDDVRKYTEADRIARQLKRGEHFEIKEKERTCHLTEAGVREAERLAGVESFYTPGNMEWPHLIDNALKAHYLYERDREYMVKDGEIVIIDEFTGRLMTGRQWSDGLHQAVEAKERVKIKEENQTLATITLQNFFKLYRKLAGMTGTAMTEANEFYKVYGLDVVAIPTHRPMKRINYPDKIFKTEKEKFDAIIQEIREIHATGRPILVGTTSVAKSERLSKVLTMHGIPHAVLNAKYHEKESEIIAQAGARGRVTIATNMAGRGTDIVLGGNPEYQAWADLRVLKHEDGRPMYPTRLDVPIEVWKAAVAKYEPTMKAEGRAIAELGGLHIIGTERHESRRIDNQLRGRAGRQGDPGSSRFFLSLEDDLMRRFIGDFAARMIASGLPDGEAIESPMVSRQVQNAIKKIEERNFDIRKNLLEYDEVMDQQRRRIYTFRQRILDGHPAKDDILAMIDRQIEWAVRNFLSPTYGAECYAAWINQRLGVDLTAKEFVKLTPEEAEELARERALEDSRERIREAVEENLPGDVDSSEWNWRALSEWFQRQYGVTVKDKDLKAYQTINRDFDDEVDLDREGLIEHLAEQASKLIAKADLKPAAAFLEPDWGIRSLAEWFRIKFNLGVEVAELAKAAETSSEAVADQLRSRAREFYVRKEIEFPVRVGMSKYQLERSANAGPRYDRDGLAAWAAERFGQPVEPETFRTLMKHELEAELLKLSEATYKGDRLARELEAKLTACYGPPNPSNFARAVDSTPLLTSRRNTKSKTNPIVDEIAERKPAKLPEPAALADLADWVRRELDMEADPADLAEMTRDQARNQLIARLDQLHRPEMRDMEKMLVLQILDNLWMEHLRAMDHLRASVGLRGYAQVDPKSEYKREGVKLFENLWTTLSDRVTDMIFRMEQFDPGFLSHLADKQMARAVTVHEASAPSASSEIGGGPNAGTATESSGSANGETRREPLRNTQKRVGRNDPCPCGSGKKYKACCMRLQTTT